MNTLIKIFLTYAAISMLAGILYGFSMMSGIIDWYKFNLGLFIILWLGPLIASAFIGVPIGIWKLWRSKW